jgi:hypothetical protein
MARCEEKRLRVRRGIRCRDFRWARHNSIADAVALQPCGLGGPRRSTLRRACSSCGLAGRTCAPIVAFPREKRVWQPRGEKSSLLARRVVMKSWLCPSEMKMNGVRQTANAVASPSVIPAVSKPGSIRTGCRVFARRSAHGFPPPADCGNDRRNEPDEVSCTVMGFPQPIVEPVFLGTWFKVGSYDGCA